MRDLEQQWNDESKLYTPNGTAPTMDDDGKVVVRARVDRMNEACALLQKHVEGVRMERVRYSWSPHADWKGLHECSGVIYVNLALLGDKLSEHLGLLVHEVAHDVTHAHDKQWGVRLQSLFEELLTGLVQ